MVNLTELPGLEPESNWERVNRLLSSAPDNEDDEEAMRQWRCRTNFSILLYNLDVLEREESLKKHGPLLEDQLNSVNGECVRKGKRLIRKRRRVFPKSFFMVSNKRPCLEEGNNSTVLRPQRTRCDGIVRRKDEYEKKTKRNKMSGASGALPRLPCPPPVLPIGLKKIIQDMGGSEVVILVIEKTLFKTDVSRNNNRFSIPLSQVKNKFLTEEEMKHLDTRCDGNVSEVEVILVEPCLNLGRISLRKWDMATSTTFVLVKSWYSVVERNHLREGTVVQLWSFRVGPQLGFALVNI